MTLRNAFENLALDSTLQDVLDSVGDTAKEATLSEILTALGTPAQNATVAQVVSALQGTINVDVANPTNISSLARQVTLQQVVDALSGTLAVHVDNPTGTTDVSALAKDATLGQVLTALQGTLTVHVNNPTDVSTLAKDATFSKNADGGIRTHIENLPATQPVSGTVVVSNPPDVSTLAKDATLTSIDSKTPATGQATRANSSPVVIASDQTSIPTQGIDKDGATHQIRTDNVGRTKISHGQPTPTSATLSAVGNNLSIFADGFSDVIFYFTGTTVQTITFEQSPDSTDGSNGTWYGILAANQTVVTTAALTAAVTGTHVYRVSAPSASYIRARTSAYTSGSSTVVGVTTTAMAQPQVSATATMVSTTIAAPVSTIAGLTIGKILSTAGTNAVLVKAGQARLLSWELANTTASWKYFKIYSKSSGAPTVGTDVPIFTIAIPPNGVAQWASTVGISVVVGMGYSITGGAADLDTTSIAANDVIGALFYV